MADLTLVTAATLIEQALFNAINRALRKRLPPVADVAALRAAPTRGASTSGYARSDFELVFVAAKGVCYEWSTASAAADDGDLVVKPSDAGATGRWSKTASTVQTGYLLDVRLYEGEQSEDEILERLLGQWPAVVVRWESATHEPKSQVAGALYRYETDFDLWVVSSNLRGGAQPEAVVGSPIGAEAAADPGANAMIGDVKRALAGVTGEELGQPGIAYCEIGKEEPVYRSLAERRFVFALGVRVHATVANPDADLQPLASPDALHVQYRRGELRDEGAFDPQNYLVAGISVPTGAGFTKNVAAGSAWVGGALVAYAGEAHTFTALRETYRDLDPSGSMAFSERAIGADPPSLAPGALRVGKTITDSVGVVADAYLAATLTDHGQPDELPPT